MKLMIRRVSTQPLKWEKDSMYLIKEGTDEFKIIVTSGTGDPTTLTSEGLRHAIEFEGKEVHPTDTLNFIGNVEVEEKDGKTEINIKPAQWTKEW